VTGADFGMRHPVNERREIEVTMSAVAGQTPGRTVTGPDGRTQYWVADRTFVNQPMTIDGFQVDRDVIVMNGVGLSRTDLNIEQRDSDAVISVPGKAAGRGGGPVPVAVLRGTHALDVNPLPLAQKLCAALMVGDLPGVQALLARDVVWETPGPTDILPWAGKHDSPGAVGEYMRLRNQTLDIEQFKPTQFIAQGNTVAVIVDERGKSRKSGESFAGGVALWIVVEGGKARLVQFYLDAFPIVEAILSCRPFTLEPAPGASYYVSKPQPSRMTSDCFIFDAAELESPPATVQTVQRMYSALQALDVERLEVVFAPDVLWEIFGPPDLLSWAGPCRGPAAAAESARQIIETMHFDYFTPTQMICQGDTAAITIDEGGTSTATGKAFRTSVIHIVTTNSQAQVVLFRNYINTMEIVEAFLGGRPFTVG
jgi:ketosteroid isomerase-like protein